jgi:hypothetical protein
MLKSIVRRLSAVQALERAKPMVVSLLRLSETSALYRLFQKTAKEVGGEKGNLDANEFFLAGAVILEMDRKQLKDEHFRKNYLQHNFPTLQDLRDHYAARAKMVYELWSQQIGADTGIPKDAYNHLLDSAKEYWPPPSQKLEPVTIAEQERKVVEYLAAMREKDSRNG